MATTQNFQNMLNQYLANDLLKEEFIKRDYLMSSLQANGAMDKGWLTDTSGTYAPVVVPFKAGGASTVTFGSLAASADIAADTYVRGLITTPVEVWGSMKFDHKDLVNHEGVSAKNFLKLLPNTIEEFMDYMKSVVSTSLLNGKGFAKLTASSLANDGVITVDRPDFFQLGQKVECYETAGTNNSVLGYVRTINMNTKQIVLYTARSGGVVIDFSAGGDSQTLANVPKVYHDGERSNGFGGLRNILLSAANGGDANYLGFSKLAYPYLQAINVDGSTVSASNIIEKIFEAGIEVRTLGKGNPTDVVMSFSNFGRCMKLVEISKGAYNVIPNSMKTTIYGWSEITIGSVTKGQFKLVGVREMKSDVIFFIDWRALKFYSNGLFQKRKSPDGTEFYEERATTGYTYITDVSLFGDLGVLRPSYMGIMYGITLS